MFQVFQLTALSLSLRGPVICGKKFFINLERALVAENEMRCALLCVQDFVRSPNFTQRCFFSGSTIAMLTASAAISDSLLPMLYENPGVTWRPCLVLKWLLRSLRVSIRLCTVERSVKDSQGQWSAVGGVRLSSEDSGSRSRVRISNCRRRVKGVHFRQCSFYLLVLTTPAMCVLPREIRSRGR